MGTFLPLLVGMATQNGLNFCTSLFFAGAFNVATGLTFAIPMAVQPMKAIAAVAITQGLTVPQILAAGATVSAIVLVLGLTGWITTLTKWTPEAVVRGIQLSLGLSLLGKAVQMIAGAHSWLGPDSYVVAIAAAILAATLFFSSRVPVALLLFAGGLIAAGAHNPHAISSLQLGFTLPTLTSFSMADVIAAFPRAALPQIPLTTLNSVVAVCALSGRLFPDRRAEPRRVAVSVGLMNLVSAWFGAMPMCHGAGGLAGQYRFGARTNGSILFLGAAKILLAVIFGATLMTFIAAFPRTILGVMLAVSGLELALVSRDQTEPANAAVVIVTTAVSLATSNVAVGFIAGAVLHALLYARPRRESSV